MGGGLLQLVAYGAQDVYLTGNPQITFFKVVYRRHTNFAIESIRQSHNGNAKYGNTITCQISRNGDLINRVYVELTVPQIDDAKVGAAAATTQSPKAKYVNYLGLRLLKSVVIEIGGQQIDKHYADWLYIWNELSLPVGKRYAYDMMVGADSDLVSKAQTKLYVPLEFWFCRNVGLALPLIALQYHEVKLKIEFESMARCVQRMKAYNGTAYAFGSDYDISDCMVWVDYIFLDTDERRRFAQLSHEYLIEQLQFTGLESMKVGRNRIKLNFNHPCKELIWVAKKDSADFQSTFWYNYTNKNAFFDNTTETDDAENFGSSAQFTETFANYMAHLQPLKSAGNPFKSCLLQLNGNDRFAERSGSYFNLVQPYQHHTNIPMNKGINVYSFALKPEEHQPSGTLNMSRIDTAVLSVEVEAYKSIDLSTNSTTLVDNTEYDGICIYAVNYNVLRILSGMGGLAYSN